MDQRGKMFLISFQMPWGVDSTGGPGCGGSAKRRRALLWLVARAVELLLDAQQSKGRLRENVALSKDGGSGLNFQR